MSRSVFAATLGLALALSGSLFALDGCGDDEIRSTADASSPMPDAGPPSDAAIDRNAPPGPAEDVAPVIAPIVAQYGLPALASVVYRNGALVASGASGLRRVGGTTPVTSSDRFAFGQSVEALTATLAATLVEAGVVSWSTTLGEVFSTIQVHALYTGTSLETLLAHRSGAPATIATPLVDAARADGDPRSLRAAAAASLLASGPTEAQGHERPSDAGYLLAAAMLERRANAPWERLVAERVLAPLGTASCSSGPSVGDAGAASDALPWGHVPNAGALDPVAPGSIFEPPPSLAPALGVRCSLEGWAKLALLHLRGARGEPTPLLAPASFAKLQTPTSGFIALGWSAVSRTWAGDALALTSGSREASAYTRTWVLPDRNTVIVAATNQGGQAAIKAVDDLVAELVGRFVTPFAGQ